MTTTQRQWVYVIVAGLAGGVLASLVMWWFGWAHWRLDTWLGRPRGRCAGGESRL